MHLVTLFDTIRENGQQGHARRGEVFFHGSKLALPPPLPKCSLFKLLSLGKEEIFPVTSAIFILRRSDLICFSSFRE